MKKKTLLLSLLVLSLATVQAESTNQLSTPPHVEFRYYGFYAAIDYTFMTPLNKVTFDLENHHTVDKYALNGVTAVAGFQWRAASALGLGFSYLNDASGSFSQIPVFLEFRSYYTRNRLSPFSTIQLGYSIPFGSVNPGPDYVKINQGGVTFGLSAGGRVAISRGFGVSLWAGYQMIQIRELERGFEGDPCTRQPELYHNLKAGIGFNF